MPTYHILCTLNNRPALLRVDAPNGRDALINTSRVATDMVILFATKQKEKPICI